jgi:hypothetical protein
MLSAVRVVRAATRRGVSSCRLNPNLPRGRFWSAGLLFRLTRRPGRYAAHYVQQHMIHVLLPLQVVTPRYLHATPLAAQSAPTKQADGSIIGIDLGTTNSCVSIMEVCSAFDAKKSSFPAGIRALGPRGNAYGGCWSC